MSAGRDGIGERVRWDGAWWPLTLGTIITAGLVWAILRWVP